MSQWGRITCDDVVDAGALRAHLADVESALARLQAAVRGVRALSRSVAEAGAGTGAAREPPLSPQLA